MKRSTRSLLIDSAFGAWLISVSVAAAIAQSPAPTAAPTPDSGLQEEVTVRLGEVQILVTDKNGRPIRDLKLEEIELREEGTVRKVTALEPFATRDLSSQLLPAPTPLVGETVDPAAPVTPVLPPPPVRRIVILFDAFNSRTTDRPKWVDAARSWVVKEMREADSVSIAMLLRDQVRVIVPFTSDKSILEGALGSSDMLSGSDYYDSLAEMRQLVGDLDTCEHSYDKANCARTAAQSFIFDWRTRAEKTIASLQQFSASLGAIPGRKAVLLMSDGIVQDPGAMATSAILAYFGTDTIDASRLSTVLRRDVAQELQRLNHVASGSDVTFFTFDARPSGRKNIGNDADMRAQFHERNFYGDPFSAMFEGTRGSLDVLAIGTGGRSYHGPLLLKTLPAAAAAIEGLYTITFLRDPRATSQSKLRVKVARRGVEVSFPDKFDPRRERPMTVSLELAIGQSQPLNERWVVPVHVQLPLTALTFGPTDEAHTKHAQVALFAEAVSPEGARGGEAYEMVDVALDPNQVENRLGRHFAHTLSLVIRPGAYRLRVKYADAEFHSTGERAIDFTLQSSGAVRAGIQRIGANQETGQLPTAILPSR